MSFVLIDFKEGCFQSFNFVPPKQEARACHMQQDSTKHNSKNNTGCKVW